MKTRLMIVAMFLSTLATAQTAAPRMVVTNSVLDFGELEKGKTTTLVFEFRNEGQAPLEILEIRASCGCTTAEIDKSVYQAGEAGKIPVLFESKNFVGAVTKRITILTNDPSSPKVVATIRGNVFVEVVTEPTRFMIRKTLNNPSASGSITVSTERLPRLEISDLRVSPDYLSTRPERLSDRSFRITVTADSANLPKDKTRVSGMLRFTTNSLSQSEMTSSISISIERPLKAQPTSVFFFASRKGEARDARVRLISNGGGEFTVREITTDIDFVEARIEKEDAASKTIRFTLLATAPSGKFKGQVAIKTSLTDQPEVIIPIQGSVLE